MRRFQHILYLSDGLHDETASLKQALSLAFNNGARLKMLLLYPKLPESLAAYGPGWEQTMTSQVTESVGRVKTELGISSADVPVEILPVNTNTPATYAIQMVLRDNHDLLIKSSDFAKTHSGFKAMDMELLRKCPCPVWLCRPIDRPSSEIKVAVAVDPEDNDDAKAENLAIMLLQLARSLADSCSGELSIISAWDFPCEEYLHRHPFVGLPTDEVAKSVKLAEQTHLASLKALVVKSGIGGRNQELHLRGLPDQVIPELIDTRQIDILVMGTVARTGIPGFIMGNTAENIVQKVGCSVVALKPNGFVSPVNPY